MFNKLSAHITQQFIANEVINESKKDIYYFGLKMLFTQILHLIFLLIFAFSMNLLWEALCYFVVFMAIRSNSGGYHAPNESLCFLYSLASSVVALSCLVHTPQTAKGVTLICILLFSIPILLKYAPLDSQKVPMDAIEKQVYRKRSRYALLLSLCAIGICFEHYLSFAYACGIAILVVALLLLLGRSQDTYI